MWWWRDRWTGPAGFLPPSLLDGSLQDTGKSSRTRSTHSSAASSRPSVLANGPFPACGACTARAHALLAAGLHRTSHEDPVVSWTLRNHQKVVSSHHSFTFYRAGERIKRPPDPGQNEDLHPSTHPAALFEQLEAHPLRHVDRSSPPLAPLWQLLAPSPPTPSLWTNSCCFVCQRVRTSASTWKLLSNKTLHSWECVFVCAEVTWPADGRYTTAVWEKLTRTCARERACRQHHKAAADVKTCLSRPDQRRVDAQFSQIFLMTRL